MQQCMVESGWPVATTPDGGIEYPEVTPEQADKMVADFDGCNHEKFPIDPNYLEPYTESQMTYLYQWYLDESIPCLEDLGYDGFDPPSLNVFIDTFETPTRWAPYLDIDNEQIPTGAWYTLNEECPQYPPAEDILAH